MDKENFEKYKNRKWENLKKNEKKEWEDFAVNNDFLRVWRELVKLKKCFLCKTKFPNGIIKKMPYDISTPFLNRIDGKFLFHLKTTHGIDPEMFDWQMKNVCRENKKQIDL